MSYMNNVRVIKQKLENNVVYLSTDLYKLSVQGSKLPKDYREYLTGMEIRTTPHLPPMTIMVPDKEHFNREFLADLETFNKLVNGHMW